MKKIFILGLTVLTILSAFSPEAYSQDYVPASVSISKEKVKIDGKLYYSHIVQEKQTIYSISKAYQVSVDDIYSANPGLKENGLKKNAIILIPDIPAQVPEKGKPQTQTEGKQDEGRKESEVRKQEEQPAMTARQQRKEERRKDKEDFFTHTVKWYEDLDVISEKYGVPVDIIIRVNGLTGRKLSNRQKLKIPVSLDDYQIVPEKGKAEGPSKEEISDRQEEAAAEAVGSDSLNIELRPLVPKTSINAVLMLPFNAQMSGGSESSMDFYSGALLAARDLGESGINVDLSVYDVAGGSLPITEERLLKTDVVIGPISSGDLGRLLEKAPETTYIVSPLDHRAEVLASSHGNFIQTPTPSNVQYDDLVDWIAEERKGNEKVTVIFEKGARDTHDINALIARLDKSAIEYSSFSYSILEGRNILESLKSLMSAEGRNHVLVASESEAFVNDAIRNINLMIYNKYDITLYGPSKIRSFETIEIGNLHDARLHISMAYYIDYDSPQVRDFILKYRALYNTEPTQFAFQGYDSMYYFISMCSRYGSNWPEALGLERVRMLQSDYMFRKMQPDDFSYFDMNGGGKGYVNKAVRRVVYGPDYSITVY